MFPTKFSASVVVQLFKGSKLPGLLKMNENCISKCVNELRDNCNSFSINFVASYIYICKFI